MRKQLFAVLNDDCVEEGLQWCNSKNKKSSLLKKKLKNANKRIRSIGKNINVEYYKNLEETI